MKRLISILLVALLCAGLIACGGAGPKGITKDEYDSLHIGMNMFEVSKAVGGHGENVKSFKDDNGKITQVYRIEGESGGYALISYQYDTYQMKVVAKEQNGLK